MECYLCENKDYELLHRGTRDNENIDVLRCKNCGLVFLSSFEHVHNAFYESSGMFGDKKVNLREIRESTLEDDLRRANMLKNLITEKEILDFGCGYGGFIDNARLYANNVYGIEIENSARQELELQGYKVWKSIDECNQKFDIITLFHVLEHLEYPVEYLQNLSRLLKDNQSEIIIEIPNSQDALLSYFQTAAFADFTYWSPHLFLYNSENIRLLMKKAGLKINWIKQIQRYSLGNHLYWLANGKPGGHKKWNLFNDKDLNERYENILSENNMCDTILLSISI